MATKVFIPVFGKRIRVTPLDECGRVPAPSDEQECGQIATNGFITLTLSSEVEDGVEITQHRADGSLCVSEQGDASFKHFTLEIEFCGVNPDLLAMVANADRYEDYDGDVAGIAVHEGTLSKRFALEMWTGLSGSDCGDGAESAGGYLLLPFVASGVLGDIEVDGEDAVTFSLTEAFTKGGNAWGVGPYRVVMNPDAGEDGLADVLPSALDPKDHLLLLETGIAPPPEAGEDGCSEVYDEPEITFIEEDEDEADELIIYGRGFQGAESVDVGDDTVTSVEVEGDTTIRIEKPDDVSGDTEFKVTTPVGESESFEYNLG